MNSETFLQPRRLRLAIAMLAAALAGCSQPTIPEMPPVTVTTTQAFVATVPRQQVFIGKIEAVNEVKLRARVTGFLDKVEFAGGSLVEQGQVLFEIERDPFVFRKDQAEALLEKATAELKLSEGNYRRAIDAHRGGGVTDEELAERQAQYYQAKAVQKDAEQALRLAEQDLAYTTVKAPFDGQISRTLVDAGNLVSGSGEGTQLATVISTDPVHVYFQVSEGLVNQLRRQFADSDKKAPDKGDVKIAVKLDGETDFEHEGWIDYVGIRIDGDTGTAEIRGVVPNPRNLLQPGQYARVKVFGEPIDNAVLVHEEAIGSDLRGQYLLTVNDDGLVLKKPVELGGLYMNNQMREVTPTASELEGTPPFSADDWYIARGLAKAFAGMQVVATQDAALGKPADAATPAANTSE